MLVDSALLLILVAPTPHHQLALQIVRDLLGISLYQKQVHIFLCMAASASEYYGFVPSNTSQFGVT